MTGDLEVSASRGPDALHEGSRPSAEKSMQTAIIKSMAVSVPLGIGFFVGLVALAVHNQQPDWNAWLSMAAGIGVIAGAFFGLLAGFVLSSDLFKD